MHKVLHLDLIEYNLNMDISYNELKNKEIVNLCDGAKMSHIMDVIFDSDTGRVRGFVIPGEKKFLKKSEALFIPLEKVRRIGDDVILIRYDFSDDSGVFNRKVKDKKRTLDSYCKIDNTGEPISYIKFRKLDNKKYK